MGVVGFERPVNATEVACDPTSPNNTCTGGTFGGIQDGSGFLSTIAGVNANGGGYLGATTYGSSATATGDFATAIGVGSSANAGAIAIGSSDPAGITFTTASGINSVAIGTTANSAGLNGIAIGTNAATTGNYAIAQGFGATAGAGGITSGGQPTGGIALGTDANAGTITGGSSLAIGNYASATAPAATNTGDSVAIGTQTTASAVDSIAMGAQTTASAQNTIAIGNNGTSNAGADSVVIGVASTASAAATGSVVLGNNSSATGADETVLGRNATASAAGGVALGQAAVADRAGLAGSAEAFSGTSVASNQGAVSVGAAGAERQIINVAGGTQDTDAVNLRQLRTVGSNLATSLGGNAAFDPTTGAYTAPTYTVGGNNYNNVGSAITALNAASGTGAFVTNGGTAPSATGTNASAGGSGATAAGLNSVAVGPQATALATNDIAIGTNAAARSTTTGGAIATSAIAIGANSVVSAPAGSINSGIAIGYGSNATTTNAAASSPVAIGFDTNAAGAGAQVAIGDRAVATGTDAIGIGGHANSPGVNASGNQSIAIGQTALSSGNSSVAIGNGVTAGGIGSLALGNNTTASVTNGVAIGTGANSSVVGGLALGAGSTATRAGLGGAAEAFSQTAVASTQGAVSVGATGAERQVSNVAGGTQDTDAVNVRQLRTVGSNLATSLGGNAAFDPTTGAYTQPSYTVGGQNYNNVGDALTAGSALAVQYTPNGAGAPTNAVDLTRGGTLAPVSLTGLANATTPTGAVALGQMPMQYSTAAAPTTANPAVPSNDVTLVGANAAAPVALHNVAAGALTANSTDAVNGSQLYTTNQQVAGLANGTAGLVQQAGPGAPITVGAGTNGTDVNFANNAAAARTLSGVAPGAVSVASTQAINGAQLYGISASLATALGGGATVNPDGTVSAPTYTVAGTNYNNVGSAIGALDNGISNGQVGAFRSDNTAGAAAPAATGANSVAGGFGSSATGAGSTAIGNGASDNGNANATVVGNGASVTAGLAGSNIALGQGTVAGRGAETNYTGYGVGTQTSAGELAVGTPTAARTITGVAAGRLPTDAANVGQLQAVGTNLATSLGGGAAFDPVTGAYTAPSYTVAGTAYDNVGSAIGAIDSGLANGQIGAFRSDNTAGAAAPTATGANSVAGGFGASATGAGSTVIGNGATDNANANAVVLGNGASVAVGLAGSNVALGQGSAAARGAQTNYNAFGLATPQTSVGEVAVGSAAAPRQITGVAAGSEATDAVNVAQLRGAVGDLGTSTAAALGGGSTYDPATGQITAPSYSLNNGTVTANNVGDALTNLDGRTTQNTNAIAGLQSGTSGIVQQAGAGAPITVGAANDGTVVNFRNNANAARTLTGVAAGQVAHGSTDAVNGGQLYGNAASVASALGGGSTVNGDGSITAPSYAVGGTAYNNVGGAITALDSTGVKYDTVPGGGRGQSITLAGGDPNQPVVIHNVAAGTQRTDAANVGQVQDAEARAKQYTNQRLAGLENDLSGVNDRLSSMQSDVNQAKQDAHSAAAIGLAAASLRYDDRPGKFSVAAGGGYWKGEGAAAWGLGYTLPDGNLRINATAATTGRDVGAGAGLSYTFN